VDPSTCAFINPRCVALEPHPPVLEGRGSPLQPQPKSAGLPSITRQRVGFLLIFLITAPPPPPDSYLLCITLLQFCIAVSSTKWRVRLLEFMLCV